MTEEPEDTFEPVTALAGCGLYFQRELCDDSTAACTVFFSFRVVNDLHRRDFRELHFGYDPVPEIYLLSELFDHFFPPLAYLGKLADELTPDDPRFFLEGLGCYVELSPSDRDRLSARLQMPLPTPLPGQRTGVVLMCWDRIEALAERWADGPRDLLHVVGFHEHSHAARAAALLKAGDPELLRREETVAQLETYMFLRGRTYCGAGQAIEMMKKLMNEQPNCYRIPIP